MSDTSNGGDEPMTATNDQPDDSESRRDTVPPPPDYGEEYNAETVIRDVPREALDAIREDRKTSEKNRAAELKTGSAEEQTAVSEETAAAKEDEKKEESDDAEALAPEKAAVKIAAKSSEKKAAPTAHADQKVIEQPVTIGELTLAFAAAVALIVVGFYVIGGAF